MSKLNTNRTAQTQLVAEFVFDFDDTMEDINGVLQDFAAAGSKVFDMSGIPPDAVIMGGEIVTETAIAGSTGYDISVGDSAAAGRYANGVNKLAAGRTALNLTGFVTDGTPLRLTVDITGEATAGKISVRAVYAVRDRGGEVAAY